MTWLVPRAGFSVIDPNTRLPLPADGADITINSYWLRRLCDGDVTQTEKSPLEAKQQGTEV